MRFVCTAHKRLQEYVSVKTLIVWRRKSVRPQRHTFMHSHIHRIWFCLCAYTNLYCICVCVWVLYLSATLFNYSAHSLNAMKCESFYDVPKITSKFCRSSSRLFLLFRVWPRWGKRKYKISFYSICASIVFGHTKLKHVLEHRILVLHIFPWWNKYCGWWKCDYSMVSVYFH